MGVQDSQFFQVLILSDGDDHSFTIRKVLIFIRPIAYNIYICIHAICCVLYMYSSMSIYIYILYIVQDIYSAQHVYCVVCSAFIYICVYIQCVYIYIHRDRYSVYSREQYISRLYYVIQRNKHITDLQSFQLQQLPSKQSSAMFFKVILQLLIAVVYVYLFIVALY